MHSRRWILIVGIAAVVVAAIIYGFLPRPLPVEIIAVSRGPMMVAVEEEGKTVVKDRFVLSAPVAGYLRRVALEVGDQVRKGQAVFELEPLRPEVLDPRRHAAAAAALSAAEAALKSAEENVRAAKADADVAKAHADRIAKLLEEGFVSRGDRDRADGEAKRSEALRESAAAAAAAARFEREKARTALQFPSAGPADISRKVQVSSPANGRILKIHRKSEGVVNSGEPVLDIGDPAGLEVRTEVLSADAVRIRPGSRVFFERWGGDQPLEGQVRVVEPAGFTKVSSLGVEEQRVLVVSDISSIPGSWQSLGDGYRVEARFIIWEADDVLRVPASALFRHKEGWAVFLVQNGKARLRSVSTGHRNGTTAEVLDGLSEGDMVIAHPDDLVKDGIRVRRR